MTLSRDVHKHELGSKKPCGRQDDALRMVRNIWPTATAEGSTHDEVSFWQDGILVGHYWRPRRRDAHSWIRIRDVGV